MLNLDTHILIYALRGELHGNERRLLAGTEWSVSSIVFWEIAKLIQLDRVELDLDDRQVVRALSRIRSWPIDLAVARASTRLDFRGDPADEIIAATSIVQGIPLVTRDAVIRTSALVPLAT